MPDGRLITADADGWVKAWDVNTGRKLDDIPAHSDRVLDVSVSSDGKTIATGGSDNAARMWTPRNSPSAHTRLRDGFVDLLDLAFSPDGKHFASASGDGIVRLWDTHSGTPVRRFKRQNEPVTGIDFSLDGKHVAIITSNVSTADDVSDELVVFDAATGDEVRRHPLPGIKKSRAIRFSPDGEYLCFLGEGELRIWNESTRSLEQPIVLGDGTSRGMWLDFADGLVGCSTMGSSGRVRVWKFPSRELIYESPDPPGTAFSFAFSISGDGEYIAASDVEGLRCFDFAKSQVATLCTNFGATRINRCSSSSHLMERDSCQRARTDPSFYGIWHPAKKYCDFVTTIIGSGRHGSHRMVEL